MSRYKPVTSTPIKYRVRIVYPMPIKPELEGYIEVIAKSAEGELIGASTNYQDRDLDFDFEDRDRATFVIRQLVTISGLEISIRRVR